MSAVADVIVVIPARNVADVIHEQLQALNGQVDAPPFDVIVVDNGSSDRTAAAVGDWKPSGYNLSVISEPRQGINFARNAGIAATAHRWILVCDADDRVSTGWVKAMSESLTDQSFSGSPIEYRRLNDERTLRLWGKQQAPSAQDHPVGLPIGCGFGLPRSMWDELGGFDSGLALYGFDETEFFVRALHAGYTLVWATGCEVAYRLSPSRRVMLRKRYRLGCSVAAYGETPGGRLDPRSETPWMALKIWLHLLLRGPLALARDETRDAWIGTFAYRVGRVRGSATLALRRGWRRGD